MAIPVPMQFGSKINDVSNKQNRNWVLLWENPDPSSSFASQTVSLDLSDYDAVYVYAKYRAANTNSCPTALALIGTGSQLFYLANLSAASSQANVRNYSVTSTGVAFESTYRKTLTATSAGSVANDYIIPVAIYGVKFG